MTDKVVEATTELVDVETKGNTTYGEEATTEAFTNAAKIENVSITATTATGVEIVSETDSSTTTTESNIDISTDTGSGPNIGSPCIFSFIDYYEKTHVSCTLKNPL